MSAILPVASEIERFADPVEAVLISCERAKAWLATALEGYQIEQIVEMKSQAEAIRVYTVQKQLGKDAEIAAAEIVRRSERCIGLAIRKGQAEGSIARTTAHVGGGNMKTVTVAAGVRHRSDVAALCDLADGVTDTAFESALSEAKAEKNLSRANVVRKVRARGEAGANRWADLASLAASGHTSHQIAKKLGVGQEAVRRAATRFGVDLRADRVVGKTRRFDHAKALREFVGTVDSLAPSVDMIDLSDIAPAVLAECAEIMSEGMRALRKFERALKEVANLG